MTVIFASIFAWYIIIKCYTRTLILCCHCGCSTETNAGLILQTLSACLSSHIEMSSISLCLVVVGQKMCTHILENHLGYHACQLIHWQRNSFQKVLLDGRAQSWLSCFSALEETCWYFANYIFLHVNSIFPDNRVLCKAIYSHVARQREHFWADYSPAASLLIRKGYSLSAGVSMRGWCHCVWFPQLTRILESD